MPKNGKIATASKRNLGSSRDNGLNSQSLAFVEALYADFNEDPTSVPSDWQDYFSKLREEPSAESRRGPTFQPSSIFNPPVAVNGRSAKTAIESAALQERVDQLVHAYRVKGHLVAQMDPLGMPRQRPA